MANCECVPAFVTSTARSTSPNWHSFKESIALQLRPVACDTSMKPRSSCTLRAAVNLGGGRLSGPPLAVQAMAAGAIMGVAAAELLRSVAMRWWLSLLCWWIIVVVVVGISFPAVDFCRFFRAGMESTATEKFSESTAAAAVQKRELVRCVFFNYDRMKILQTRSPAGAFGAALGPFARVTQQQQQ